VASVTENSEECGRSQPCPYRSGEGLGHVAGGARYKPPFVVEKFWEHGRCFAMRVGPRSMILAGVGILWYRFLPKIIYLFAECSFYAEDPK
jgi:hypothetical protein